MTAIPLLALAPSQYPKPSFPQCASLFHVSEPLMERERVCVCVCPDKGGGEWGDVNNSSTVQSPPIICHDVLAGREG